MKQEDFERLKAVCEKEGFVISTGGLIPSDSILLEVYKKDIWEGVEFASLTNCTHGFVYKVIEQKPNEIHIIANGNQWFSKSMFQPSTEYAYIEQLKKESYERFGEIKPTDKFDTEVGKSRHCSPNCKQWVYDNYTDILFAYGVRIYQEGKWATRVKERVKVYPTSMSQDFNGTGVTFDFKFDQKRNLSIIDASEFLASQLEAYLNLDGYSVDVSGETLSIHVKIRNGVDLEDLKEKAESLAKIVKKI